MDSKDKIDTQLPFMTICFAYTAGILVFVNAGREIKYQNIKNIKRLIIVTNIEDIMHYEKYISVNLIGSFIIEILFSINP